MITPEQCAAFAELASNELARGALPSTNHNSLLLFYLQDLEIVGPESVRDVIVADIRVSLSLGATRQAADLLIGTAEISFRISGSQNSRKVSTSGSACARLQYSKGRHRPRQVPRDEKQAAASKRDNVVIHRARRDSPNSCRGPWTQLNDVAQARNASNPPSRESKSCDEEINGGAIKHREPSRQRDRHERPHEKGA